MGNRWCESLRRDLSSERVEPRPVNQRPSEGHLSACRCFISLTISVHSPIEIRLHRSKRLLEGSLRPIVRISGRADTDAADRRVVHGLYSRAPACGSLPAPVSNARADEVIE